MITFLPTTSFNVPVHIMKANTFVKAKILGSRNHVTKLNVFLPTGATIAYTRSPITKSPGEIQDFDRRFIHFHETDLQMFTELHRDFHQ